MGVCMTGVGTVVWLVATLWFGRIGDDGRDVIGWVREDV